MMERRRQLSGKSKGFQRKAHYIHLPLITPCRREQEVIVCAGAALCEQPIRSLKGICKFAQLQSVGKDTGSVARFTLDVF